jgi:hypothetical protein
MRSDEHIVRSRGRAKPRQLGPDPAAVNLTLVASDAILRPLTMVTEAEPQRKTEMERPG